MLSSTSTDEPVDPLLSLKLMIAAFILVLAIVIRPTDEVIVVVFCCWMSCTVVLDGQGGGEGEEVKSYRRWLFFR
jgi:hypothetical protein